MTKLIHCAHDLNSLRASSPFEGYLEKQTCERHARGDTQAERAYRKIPKISPGTYTFQRPFLRGLFLEEPIFGGAYVRREICVSKSIGLACSGKETYHFYFVLLCIQGQIPSTSPRGAYIRRGDLTKGLRYDFGGLYLEGLIFGILGYLN